MSVEKFTVYNPTRLHFGVGIIDKLGKSARKYGKKALLVYGKGSVVKYGYYDKVVEQLRENGIEFVTYSGIKPNPVIEDVENASKIAINNGIDIIIALGGGSVVDSAKIISLVVGSGYKGWDIIKNKAKPDRAIPLLCILTLAATGSEMNAAAVIQNHETGEKLGFVNELMFPKESFLDPSFTCTVPKDYTSYGIVDLIIHALEAFFGKGEPPVTDTITCEIIKDAMVWGPKLLADLENIELRSHIMLDATLALNGLTQYGKKGGDWGVHAIGHELSLLFDLPHGATLSIACIAWLKFQKERIPGRILSLGKKLFNTDTVEETIIRLDDLFKEIGSPTNLYQVGIKPDKKQLILEQMNRNSVSGLNHKLDESDRFVLVNYMFNE